mmetsp:Transcript_38704/g.96880  ORF Transcript_38704/g.96880 Transcript_38704/m.96880 type:complete len:251 (+) Transcript_38704:1066-1818(+)
MQSAASNRSLLISRMVMAKSRSSTANVLSSISPSISCPFSFLNAINGFSRPITLSPGCPSVSLCPAEHRFTHAARVAMSRQSTRFCCTSSGDGQEEAAPCPGLSALSPHVYAKRVSTYLQAVSCAAPGGVLDRLCSVKLRACFSLSEVSFCSRLVSTSNSSGHSSARILSRPNASLVTQRRHSSVNVRISRSSLLSNLLNSPRMPALCASTTSSPIFSASLSWRKHFVVRTRSPLCAVSFLYSSSACQLP